MIDTVFLFFAKVMTVLICIATMLAPICVAFMFCYGFYKDYLCLPKKEKDKGKAANITSTVPKGSGGYGTLD